MKIFWAAHTPARLAGQACLPDCAIQAGFPLQVLVRPGRAQSPVKSVLRAFRYNRCRNTAASISIMLITFLVWSLYISIFESLIESNKE